MLQPNQKIGDYTLKRKIGKGAYGVVWLAEKKGIISTDFALKMPNEFDVDLALIEREAILWKKASGHTNVLPIIEARIYDEQIVIVSEYVSDGSLQDRLDKLAINNELMPVEEVAELLLGVLSGLQHLHSKSILHQDLKPANILLQGGTPRLADFGISGTLSSKSSVKGTFGTVPYLSPETFVGVRSVQTDIWSVGVIFYQLLSGRLPFPQQDIPSVMNSIINHDPLPLLGSIPKPLREIVERALQKNTEQRYKSAADMRRAVREVQFPASVVPTQDSTPPIIETIPTPQPAVPPILLAETQAAIFSEPQVQRSRAWLWGLVTLGLALAALTVGLITLYFWSPQREQRPASADTAFKNTNSNSIIATPASSPTPTPSPSPTPINVTGTWDMNGELDHLEKVRFSQSGSSIVINKLVRGELADDGQPYWIREEDGKLVNDKITFCLKTIGWDLSSCYKGTVSGDSIKGTEDQDNPSHFAGRGNPRAERWTAKRISNIGTQPNVVDGRGKKRP